MSDKHTLEAKMAAIARARERRNTFQAEMAQNLTDRKQIRRRLALASAELEQAIGSDGVTAAIDMDEFASPEPGKPLTNQAIKDRRKHTTWAKAHRALLAGGGRMSNMDLSSLLGLSPHGLAGLLDGCPTILKVHDGRQNNEVTYWQATA